MWVFFLLLVAKIATKGCLEPPMLMLLESNLYASARSVLEPRKYVGVAVIMVLRSQGFFYCDLFFYPIWISKY